MRLIKLELSNFKGIKSFKLEPQGKDIAVLGDNATGKTTLFDAFLWLLFDKDSQNKKDFDIKTLDSTGEAMHGLEHSVEATMQLEGGMKLRSTQRSGQSSGDLPPRLSPATQLTTL